MSSDSESLSQPLYKPFEPPEQSRTFGLFWKVLVLVVLTAVIATITIGLYLSYVLRTPYSEVIAEQLQGYVELVAAEIGSPPNVGKIAELTERYPFDICIEGQGQSWSSDSTIPHKAHLHSINEWTEFDAPPGFVFTELNGRFYGVLDRNGYSYIIRFNAGRSVGNFLPATAMLVFVLFALFAAAYWAVKNFLHPVSELMEGVKAVGSANFKYRVPVRSYDELGTLTSAFNAMSEQIEEIIASKRRLLFDVSHELRSPLTRMGIAIAMLPETKTREKLERNANELNTMITELLENERLSVLGGAIVVEPIDLVEVARKVIESFTEDQERIEFDTLTESLPMKADTQRLIVALRNIISNALKYSDSNNPPVVVSVFPDDDGVRVVVKDHGVGIPEEALEKIFEAFYRTDESRTRATGGYGLGLALTKSIIEAHGGMIHATSKEGEGTAITIWLPFVPVTGMVKAKQRKIQG